MKIAMTEVLRRPRITEKAVYQQNLYNQYTFEVHPDANKVMIKEAVERLFDVKVLGVKVSNNLGKLRRTRLGVGRTQAWKKAVVRLAEGQSIEGA